MRRHPAFYAGIQIELSEEADKLVYEREHNLGTKPLLIDVLIIKKNSQDRIKKNIGHIFRKYNIVEYKSPVDYLSIDDFYKVYGYCCFYKSQAKKQNDIKIDELTITFVSYHYPRKFFKHLKARRGIQIEKYDKGIYYLIGDIIPMQVIVTPKLSEEQNLWLKHLTKRSYTGTGQYFYRYISRRSFGSSDVDESGRIVAQDQKTGPVLF